MTLLARSALLLPLEKLTPADILGGTQGTNRQQGDHCSISSKNDLEAIRLWLQLHQDTPHTYRAYRKEAERLLLWAIKEQKKPFSSLMTEDCLAYRYFLASPPPHWLGTVCTRNEKIWRPFQKGLSKRSIQQAETILSGLFKWLVKCHYLVINPYDQLPKKYTQAAIQTHHAIPEELWLDIMAFCQQKIELSEAEKVKSDWVRYYFILRLGYGTGLRIHELIAIKLGDLTTIFRGRQKQVWLTVLGKGDKAREVPFPPWLQDDLSLYLSARGLSTIIQENDPDLPVIGKVKGAGHLSLEGMHKLVKRMFRLLYDELTLQAEQSKRGRDTLDYGILLKASTHWLRHTHGTHQADNEVPLHLIRDNLGHASIATTSIYVNSDKSKRYAAIEEINLE